MPPREDDIAPRVGAPRSRTLIVAGGFALAAVATLAVFLTDNPQYLRVAVVAVAWAFVLATFAAGRRDTDRVAASAREAELRRAYEAELDREVAARREYELELEHELRREAEESMRYELDALRGDIAELSSLRDEVARVSELRGDLAALSGLRDDVARVAALRDDVAALMSLRQELGQLGDLRADMGRLRAELTEQLSSEMLVERIVMRTQASRLPAEPGRTDSGQGRALDGSGWADDVPPRELTGGWPAIRLDEPRETQHFEQVRVERSGSRPPVPGSADGRTSWQVSAVEPRPWDAPLPTRHTPATGEWSPAAGTSVWPAAPSTEAGFLPEAHVADEPTGPPPTTMSAIAPASIARPPAPVAAPPATPPPPASPSPPMWQAPGPASPPVPAVQEGRRSRAELPPVPPPVAPPSPLDWLAARSLLDGPAPTPSRPEVPPLRRRADDVLPVAEVPAEPRTAYRPAVAPGPPSVRIDDRGGYRVAVRDQEPATAPGSGEGNRLAEILAENGVTPSSGGRRRRRYRDEDEPDDVLARVLGQS
ncbi:hypothetical protein E4P39_14755 [Blastococcus sp. CT_GayMR19]|uniref:DUF6779 domain-containing protein n=1 Tax=Blastococcus sp. CT_GayMR19 TaxID=2559608 RepID=UPI0010730469|nr:DUF6779 domain-containing protein [Blastococcus sp. CT_GayMR19]TFV73371.1 hypothetical protein E4P39_14755 [Blastococcus sp. CT_GayMR19]